MSESKTEGKEHEEYGNRANDGIKVTLPFGWGTVYAHGPMVIAVVLLVGAVALGLFMLRDHDIRSAERDAQMLANQVAFKDSQNESTYVLAKCLLSKEECQKVQLGMPDSLRGKIPGADRR